MDQAGMNCLPRSKAGILTTGSFSFKLTAVHVSPELGLAGFVCCSHREIRLNLMLTMVFGWVEEYEKKVWHA